MLKIIRFLFGYVVFVAEGPFPERFINLITRKGIGLFNTKRVENSFYASAMAAEYKSLRHIARKSGMKIRLKEKHGLPFVIKKYKKRMGLFIGIAAYAATIWFLSLFVWTIDISGNISIDEEEITAVMQELGIHTGSLKSETDVFLLEKSLMTSFENISWISANIKGSSLKISIKESTKAPEIIPNDEPCNIIAAQDAQITRMEVYNGKEEVKNGDAVLKGQLLVNSVIEDSYSRSRLTHADAKILATTKRIIKQEIDLFPKEDLPTGNSVKRRIINILGIRIPLTLKKVPKGNFKRDIKIQNVSVFGNKLPISFYEETWSEFKPQQSKLTVEQAARKAEQKILDREKIELKDVKILKKDKSENISPNKYCTIVTYTCEENIAKQEKIITE